MINKGTRDARRRRMKLSEEVLARCRATGTSPKGIEELVGFYVRNLGWDEAKANAYALALFEDGTIAMIKGICHGEKEDGAKDPELR